MTLANYVKELSKELELNRSLDQNAEGAYELPLDADLVVELSETASSEYSFYSKIALAPVGNKEHALSQLLYANLFGQGTQEAILGLTAEGDKVTLLQAIRAPEYKVFSERLEAFIGTVDYWRGALKEGL